MNSKKTNLLIFIINDVKFAVDALNITEVIRIQKINKIYKLPIFIKGIINYRSVSIPVLDLRERFGLIPSAAELQNRIIIVKLKKPDSGSDYFSAGFVVDKVDEVISIDEKFFEPPPQMTTGIENKFLKGIYKLNSETIIELDIEKILTSCEKIELVKSVKELKIDN